MSGAVGWLLFAGSVALGQQYPILPVAGSPHGIYTMMQDNQSRLWLGTIDDVFCFDGVRFFSLRKYGFPGETPNTFAADSSGGIWIGTQGTAAGGGTGHGGLYRYQAGRVEKLFSGDVLSITSISSGFLLASFGAETSGKPAYGDLYRVVRQGERWTFEPLKRKAVNHMTVDKDGTVLFPCPAGWCELPHRRIEKWRSQDGPLPFQEHAASTLIERVLRDRFGCLWFRAEAFASYQCPGMKGAATVPGSISAYDLSAHLEEAPDGSVFMLVSLALGRPGAFHVARGRNGIPSGLDTAMVARDGTIWLGTEAGLYRFMYPFQLEYWTSLNGLETPSSILCLDNDHLFVTASAGLQTLSPDRRTWISVPGTEKLTHLATLAEGPEGTVLAGSTTGLTQLTRAGEVLARTANMGQQTVWPSLAATPNGHIWFGGKGLNRIVRAGNKLLVSHEDVPDEGVPSLQYDPERNILWACAGKEVAFRNGGVWRRIAAKDGLLDANCRSLAAQPNGDLWLGYDNAAFAVIKNPASNGRSVRNFTEGLNRLTANSATTFLGVDHRGWLWRGADANYVANPKAAERGEWLRLDQQDGVPKPGGNVNAFSSGADGSVWFSSEDMVAHLSLAPEFATSFPAPPVFLSAFTVGQAPPVLADTLEAVPNGLELVAHVGSLQFDRRNALRLRYRLLPEQTRWRVQREMDIPLGKLRWGRHRLEVQAQLATGPWSVSAAKSFAVSRPLWLGTPLLVSYFVAAAALTTGGYFLRRRWKVENEQLLPDLTPWRLEALAAEGEPYTGELLDSRFEVGPLLARGGFANVMEAFDRNRKERCAVKIFRTEVKNKAWIQRSFDQEVAALAKVRHPNVVSINAHGRTASGAPYLAMEFLEGRSLREVLAEGALTPRRTARLLQQLAGALTAIHAQGICHRDFKPENVIVLNEGTVEEAAVLIDFSIAIIKDADETLHGLSRAAGTFDYMAPEQAVGYAEPSSDVYSLSRLLIEMLTGRLLRDLLPGAALDLPKRVRGLIGSLNLHLSEESIETLAAALEFDPGRRPSAPATFAAPLVRDLASDNTHRDL